MREVITKVVRIQYCQVDMANSYLVGKLEEILGLVEEPISKMVGWEGIHALQHSLEDLHQSN